MRIIFYTGKGGVGKTSIAAATALHMADSGLRTLVLSTDAAHSLSDSFGIPLGAEPTPIAERLDGLEIDSLRETERNWSSVQHWLSGVMSWAKLDDIQHEEMIVFPGMEELFSLLKIKDYAQSDHYDALVVDCAPTGETLRLLSYPNVIRWWLEKIFPFERMLIKTVRPVAKLVTGGLELPDNRTLNAIEAFVRQVEDMNEWVFQRNEASVRLVMNPEKMVVAEARRSFTYLNLYGFQTDAVLVNKVLPKEAAQGYFNGWQQIQQRHMAEIEDSFSPLPIIQVPLLAEEVTGFAMLRKVATIAFTDLEPASLLYEGRVEEMVKQDGVYRYSIRLPFVAKDELDLRQKADELTIQVGPYRRKTTLPRTLTGRPITSARFADQKLILSFGERSAGEAEDDTKAETETKGGG